MHGVSVLRVIVAIIAGSFLALISPTFVISVRFSIPRKLVFVYWKHSIAAV